jgi:hypothetical protein
VIVGVVQLDCVLLVGGLDLKSVSMPSSFHSASVHLINNANDLDMICDHHTMCISNQNRHSMYIRILRKKVIRNA